MTRYDKLIQKLINEKYLSTPRIIEAFRNNPRQPYLPETHKRFDSLNAPLPIGQGQTTSQPLTIALMIEFLQPRAGHTVLEIGYGSGWLTAILADIVSPPHASKKKQGTIHTYEIVPEVARFGKENLKQAQQTRIGTVIHIHRGDYKKDFRNHGPYDRIIAGAAFEKTPEHLIEMLKPGGIIVYPTQAHDIRRITRNDTFHYTEEIFPGFVFVPITH